MFCNSFSFGRIPKDFQSVMKPSMQMLFEIKRKFVVESFLNFVQMAIVTMVKKHEIAIKFKK